MIMNNTHLGEAEHPPMPLWTHSLEQVRCPAATPDENPLPVDNENRVVIRVEIVRGLAQPNRHDDTFGGPRTKPWDLKNMISTQEGVNDACTIKR